MKDRWSVLIVCIAPVVVDLIYLFFGGGIECIHFCSVAVSEKLSVSARARRTKAAATREVSPCAEAPSYTPQKSRVIALGTPPGAIIKSNSRGPQTFCL